MEFGQKITFSTFYDVITKNHWYTREIKVGDVSKATIYIKIYKILTYIPDIFS